MAITFYDIPSTFPNNVWSPNTWKARRVAYLISNRSEVLIFGTRRYCLNYKRIPYKTEWVEYPDIEPLCKRLGIAPTDKKKDGSGRRTNYSLPASTEPFQRAAYVSDSFAIAQVPRQGT
ncbi:hypothetical protein NLJ89_g4435 [Agrocybe chaxingu]|uniref:Uncharacterized protein n=1 Tax=Agrocybe chaxingu TaxID=84603 RepID=A0A9W8MXQ4_9AGAR|nr:hypothetical protein NLJ89_g4435 [Agrocybe chaxingu]